MTEKQVLEQTIEKINEKHGALTVVNASEIENKKSPRGEPTKDNGNNNYDSNSSLIISYKERGCKVRNLKKEEIECKVSSVKESKGLSLLLYKTARTDTLILDETFGKMNWQCKYKEIKGNMYCGISVFDDSKNQWVTKWDCGIESAFGDKQKGEASDSFKRAGFKWGIGIELYTSPLIWIPNDKCNIKGGRCYDKFSVEKIAIKEKEIIGLAIRNVSKNNQRVFVWKREGE